jgi:hypothetical protein
MLKQAIYGVLALVGVSLTWYHNIQFSLGGENATAAAFVADCFVNHASSSIAFDVTVATVTFLTWSNIEAKRLGMKGWWAIVILTMTVALAFAFPLFLLLRERKLEAARAASPAV